MQTQINQQSALESYTKFFLMKKGIFLVLGSFVTALLTGIANRLLHFIAGKMEAPAPHYLDYLVNGVYLICLCVAFFGLILCLLGAVKNLHSVIFRTRSR